MERPALAEARDAILRSDSNHASLSEPFVSAFPVTGAAISVLVGPASQTTISSSDQVAERLDELQFDLGEGPCWSAMSGRAPVLRPRIKTAGMAEWPAFTEALANDAKTSAVGAMFAFPLAVGTLDIGAIDFYAVEPAATLDPSMVSEASGLADLTAWQVLRRIVEDIGADYDGKSLGFARREVHQATGMIIAQVGVTADDAQLLLRAHAFASSRTVAEVAHDVVERKLTFTGILPPNGQE